MYVAEVNTILFYTHVQSILKKYFETKFNHMLHHLLTVNQSMYDFYLALQRYIICEYKLISTLKIFCTIDFSSGYK